jgi:uncharacterized protein
MAEKNPQYPPMKKMLKLSVFVRNTDKHDGKTIPDVLLELFKKKGISGATVLQGVRGYGVRGASRADVLGLSINLPLIIQTIDEYQKVESVLSDVKNIVGSNGLITLEEVNAF